ncbi:hypothetical protein A4G19_10095 [Pasteurellaceae bacterium Macca]|nr:hypothetical protein [Pasteurellaceae bacterium Macca]
MENQITLLSKEKSHQYDKPKLPYHLANDEKRHIPKSVSASNRRVAWFAKDIEQWLSERA